jgi:prephenate dehydrogenase
MTGAAPRFRRVAVIGTGLIGGSVAGAIRGRGLAAEVVGHDPRDADEALRRGLLDASAASAAAAMRGADLVVLAAPVAANRELLQAIGRLPSDALAPGAVITDVSSTKRSIVDAASRWLGPLHSRFVASHPIAGSERHGAAHASAALFDGCAALVCPTGASAPDAIARIEALWRDLGARVARMSAERHDRLFAAVSHWPHAVAFALSAAVGGSELAEDARRYSGAGLRDTTRVGASSPELWADILLDNRDAALAAAASFRVELDAIERALGEADRTGLVEALARGSRWRGTL